MADKYFVHKQCSLIVAVRNHVKCFKSGRSRELTQERFSVCESGRGWSDQERLLSIYQTGQNLAGWFNQLASHF